MSYKKWILKYKWLEEEIKETLYKLEECKVEFYDFFEDIFDEKKIEEEELRVNDWSILMGFVASGVEPRGIKLVDSFYDDYNKIYEAEIEKKKYFSIIKRSPLYICKK